MAARTSQWHVWQARGGREPALTKKENLGVEADVATKPRTNTIHPYCDCNKVEVSSLWPSRKVVSPRHRQDESKMDHSTIANGMELTKRNNEIEEEPKK